MKHITEDHGMKVNRLRINIDDYKELQKFLNEIGVEMRLTQSCGDGTKDYIVQVRNVHAEECIRTGGLVSYNAAKVEAQHVIEKGCWRR